MTAPATQPWRADLAGLRAVAVGLVVAFHLWGGRVSGGVDVFLMLSGFFVGGSLWRRYRESERPRLRPFYLRQAGRLIPSLVAALMATAAVALLLLPRNRWPGGAREILASIGYVENWYLAASAHEYGAADPSQSPWQHLWSLSVQGQFFLLVPLALTLVHLLTRRLTAQGRGAAFLALLLGLLVSSFAVATYLSTTDQAVAYFHTYARLWEFLLGTLIALLPDLGWRRLAPASAVMGWFGLAAILATGFLVDGAATFPGPAALLPVGGAAAVILCRHRFGPSLLLSLRPIELAGRYAYGLYLWHWPVLVFAIVAGLRRIRFLTSPFVVVVSVLLAVASYHLLEVPMTRRSPAAPQRSRRVVRGLAWAMSVVLVAGSAGWLVKLDSDRKTLLATSPTSELATHPGALAFLDPAFADYPTDVEPIPELEILGGNWPSVVEDKCITPADSDGSQVVRCSYGKTDSDFVVALVGASHAEEWFSVVKDMAERRGWRLDVYLRPGCLLAVPAANPEHDCDRWLLNLYERLAADPPDVVVTNSTRQEGRTDTVSDGYRAAFAKITEHSALVGLRDNARFDPPMPECYQGTGSCEIPLRKRLAAVDPALSLDLPRAAFLDLNDLICPDGVCRPVIGNRFVFRDGDHLSDSYMQTLAGVAGDRIAAAVEKVAGQPTR
jgi:Predicted acyltransferases